MDANTAVAPRDLTKNQIWAMYQLAEAQRNDLAVKLNQCEASNEVLRSQIDKLTTRRADKPPAEVRYWDEFEAPSAGLAWAKEHKGVVRQRPAQRAGG